MGRARLFLLQLPWPLQKLNDLDAYHAVMPPSTTMFAPVMYDDASEQSSSKAPESSSDRPVRFSMVFPESLPMNSMSDCGVTFGKGPGVSEFTRMFFDASAAAQ